MAQSQNMIVSLLHVDFGPKICLILYPFYENLTTYVTIMENKEVWMKHFRVMDLKPYFENETIKKMCGANLDIMKFAYSTDPHKTLGKYHPNCWCDGCKQISKVIKKNAWRTHLTKEPREKIVDYVNEIDLLFDDHRRKHEARSSSEDSD